jgi:hypothetical protein
MVLHDNTLRERLPDGSSRHRKCVALLLQITVRTSTGRGPGATLSGGNWPAASAGEATENEERRRWPAALQVQQ